MEIEGLNHHLSSGAFLDDKQVENVCSVYLIDHFIDLDICVDMLGTTTACQMNIAITMRLAFLAQVRHDVVYVLFLQ